MSGVGSLYFAVGIDVDEEHRGGVQRVVQRRPPAVGRGLPGLRSGRRYELRGRDLPRFWAVYEVESKEALQTPELAAISGFGRFEEHVSNHRIVWLTSLTELLVHGDGA